MSAKFIFSEHDYQLLDFGQGRRLERFGGYVLDRPCPAVAHLPRARADCWSTADARFHRTSAAGGTWELLRQMPARWTAICGPLRFELKRTDFGQVGMFPEQAINWQWLYRRVSELVHTERRRRTTAAAETAALVGSQSVRVLNLFAYTGGSTLAAAAAGAEVVHVDAAKNVVAWARRNAELSGMADRPIHWVVEDAMKFVKRELRRENRYHAVILDPPSYGHGRRGEVWRLSKHLPRLLDLCAELTAGDRLFVLLTAHTPGYGPRRLSAMLAKAFGGPPQSCVTGQRLYLTSADGRQMPAGVVALWTPNTAAVAGA